MWKGEEPPSDMHDVRAAAAPLALKLEWTTLFSYRFLTGKHINLLELESLNSLLRRISRAGTREGRLWVPVDSRVVLGAVCFENWDFGVSLMTWLWNWYGYLSRRIQRMPLRGTS